jgi:GTP-binding protein
MKITSAEFIKSAVWPPQYPPATMPEIAFVGRSNVGKSSLMNTLVGRKQLAKTSQTPGRTQLINFFSVNKSIFFVDLPGYGFARVPRSVRKEWGDMIETYLRERQNLAMVVFILDIRRDPSDDDLSLLDWLENYRIPFTAILTKSDKLSNNQAIGRKRTIEKLLGANTQKETMLFSAKTQKGREDLWNIIGNHLSSLNSQERNTI